MSVRARRCHVPIALVVGLALSPAGAVMASNLPPNERVYVTSVNNKILEVDFEHGTTRTIVTSPGSNFQGLVVRGSDWNVVVADHNQGGKLKIFSTSGTTLGQGRTITSLIGFPSGVTLDQDQNLFVTNQHTGRADEVWRVRRNFGACSDGTDPVSCVNGGYFEATKLAAPLKVDGVATRTLADVKHADGKLWVLVQDPPKLLRFGGPFFPGDAGDPSPCTNPCPHDVVIPQIDGTPTGLAFTASHVLISLADGRILRFALDTFAPAGTFVSNVGGRAERIAVGRQGSTDRAFVTVHPKTVKRYDIVGGVGQLPPKQVSKLSSSVGVNLASAGAAITRANVATPNDPVEVALNCVDATFESVLQPGFSDCSCFTFLDPREKTGGCGEGIADALPLPAYCDLRLNDPDYEADLPPALFALDFDNTIPRYVRGYKKTGATAGTLHLCIAKTTALFSNLITVVGDKEIQWLGYEPSCTGALTQRPKFFVSEEPPFSATHPQLIEGNVFINNTSHCGSDGADAWNMDSLWGTGMRETRPPDNLDSVADAAPLNADGPCDDEAGVVDCQLNRLKRLVASSTCIAPANQTAFLAKLNSAIQSFDGANYCSAKSKLVLFEDLVEDAPAGAFSSSCPRLRAELRGRANAAIFAIGDSLCP